MHAPASHDASKGPSPDSHISRFIVQTTDVIQDMRVNVSEEGSDRIIWYKERYLGDDEIIENLVYNATNTICWTIHRPKRGWYIRLRSPMFPPGVFIPLIPVPQNAPYHTDAAMSFSSRTNVPSPLEIPPSMPLPQGSGSGSKPGSQFCVEGDEDDDGDLGGASSSRASLHSYPPTPTATTSELSLTSSSSPLSSIPASRNFKHKNKQSPTQITQFVLSPSSSQLSPNEAQQSTTFLARALSVLKSHKPTHSNSFTLSRVLPPSQAQNQNTPPPPYRPANSTTTLVHETFQIAPPATVLSPGLHSPLASPLLVFHDRTPVLTVYSLTGVLEIDKREEAALGVDTGFWVAVALTYLEFLEERESYLAALSD